VKTQTTATDAKKALIRMRKITKRFGAVTVLHDVNLDIFPGEVHVLAGENGAGKSTLIKILAGVHTDFEGLLTAHDDKFIRPTSPQEANQAGIVAIYQELSLVPSMTVAENIFLGRAHTIAGFISMQKQQAEARRLIAQLGLDLDVNQNVEAFPIGTQQMLEIVKALSVNAKVIIMDEPTSALSGPEVSKLFEVIATLKSRGCGIVYITHKMEEIEKIADRITVLRDGKQVGTALAADLPTPKLIQLMVGRDIDQQFPRHQTHVGASRLSVEAFSVFSSRKRQPVVSDVSFSVKAGEILGIAGLQGAGASNLLLGLFGAYGKKMTQGEVRLNGEPIRIGSPQDAIAHRMALLTNDRKATGLVLSMSIIANMTLATMRRFSPYGGLMNPALERSAAEDMQLALHLRAASLEMDVSSLSGGNQQKVAIAKWLQVKPQVLLLDEPTRGIDIGSKQEIYQLMNAWTAEGIAIILITSEMPELLAMSDRILVMHRGRMTAEFTRAEATPELILEAAMGKINGNHNS